MEYRKITMEQRISDNDNNWERGVPSFIEPLPPLITNPFQRPKIVKATHFTELFEEDSELEEPELVQVYLRLRPCETTNNLYEVRSDQSLITSTDTTTAGHGRKTQHNVSKMYTFSHIFQPTSTQKQIFEHVVKDNLKRLIDGESFTLLTYGASGSGKTYTLMGTVAAPGLVPRSLEYLFKIIDADQQPLYKPGDGVPDRLGSVQQEHELQWVKNLRNVSAPLRDKYRRMSVQLGSEMASSNHDLSSRTRYYVWVSFIEIYNEAIYDLLVPTSRRSSSKLRIREDSNGAVYVKGASQAFVRSGQEAYDVMVAGKHNLQVAATGVHAHSSRSHCIFTITLLTETETGVRSSHIRLCDLAGSERAMRTNNSGARMLESRAINSSLHVLERCLNMLRRKQTSRFATNLVPYRESKLTRLLGAGLSGGEPVSMLVTASTDVRYLHETRHVLQVAAVAKDIQVNSTVSEETTFDSSGQDSTICTADLMKLRAENERLHFQLIQTESRVKELSSVMEEQQQEAAKMMREVVEEAKDITRQFYESQIRSMEEKHRNEIEELTEEYECKLRSLSCPKNRQTDFPKLSGTPSKHLQGVVSKLHKEITILEEKLSIEKLARARADEEVEHLRTCIEERDHEKGENEKSQEENREVMSVSDEEEEESSEDEMNESLEPSFKRDRTLQKINETLEDDKSLTDNAENDETLNNTTAKTSSSSIERESLEGDSQTTLSNDTVNEDSVRETKSISSNEAPQSAIRGTYVVNEISLNESKDDVSLSHQSIIEEAENNETIHNSSARTSSSNVERESLDINVSFEGKCVGTVSKNLLDKFKRNNSNTSIKNQSLAMFEQYEKDSGYPSDTPQRNTNIFGDLNILKEKRCYFNNQQSEVNEIVDTVAVIETDPKVDTDNISNDLNKIDKPCEEIKLNENPKVLKKSYFDDDSISKNILSPRSDTDLNGLAEIVPAKEKRTYFDNISANITTKKSLDLLQSTDKVDDIRSPSIVKDDVPNDYEPTTIKKLLGDSSLSLSKSKVMSKFHDSTDMFNEENNKNAEEGQVEDIRKSINKMVLNDVKDKSLTEMILEVDNKYMPEQFIKKENNTSRDRSEEHTDTIIKDDLKKNETIQNDNDNELVHSKGCNSVTQEVDNSAENHVDIENQNKNLTNLEFESTETSKNNTASSHNNTESEFDRMFKNISSRTTEFETVLKDINNTHGFDNNTSKKEHESDNSKSETEIKYNLRHKSKNEFPPPDEDVTKSTLTKRSLRLRRNKKVQEEEESTTKKTNKLKDIANLKQEFSDVMMDIPPVKKEVKDIESPEKTGEENIAPSSDVQSCLSKSVTRSRRKLFTPRAEPIEDNIDSVGDSNEKLYVPRPSYHKGRARRKL